MPRLRHEIDERAKETRMKLKADFKLVGLSLLFAVGLAACDTKPGLAENAGKKIDQTVDEAGKKLEETVAKVGDELQEQGAKTGAVMDDAEITAKVKAAIFAEPGLKTLQISVDTIKGVVTLSGSVDSQEDSDQAKGLAGAVSGVKEVNNRLALKAN